MRFVTVYICGQKHTFQRSTFQHHAVYFTTLGRFKNVCIGFLREMLDPTIFCVFHSLFQDFKQTAPKIIFFL